MAKTLTEQQKDFVENFTTKAPGNATKSAELAGYKHPRQQGYELKNKLANEINEANIKLLSSQVPLALNQLSQLLTDNKVSASVKLGAVNSVLDRNNHTGVIKTEDVTHKKTDEKLKQELKHLLDTLDTTEPEVQVLVDVATDTTH